MAREAGAADRRLLFQIIIRVEGRQQAFPQRYLLSSVDVADGALSAVAREPNVAEIVPLNDKRSAGIQIFAVTGIGARAELDLTARNAPPRARRYQLGSSTDQQT